MEEQQWRSESVALDAPPTVQTTTVPAPKMPVGKQIPWKWVFGAGILVVALVAGLLFLRSNLAKNQEPTNNGQVKTQNVDLGKLAKNTTPLTLDKTDRVVINGQLQTTQGLVINPTAEPTTSVLGQVYLDSTTGDLRYYNGTTYLTIANSDAVGLTEVEVLALLTTFGTKLPQDLATTASPLFGGLKLNGTNGNAVLLQAAAGTANVTLTLPANGGTISQCLTTDGAGTLSFSACASGSGNAFLQGGNAFTATGVLGTTDNNDLNFITNNITRLTVAAGGNVGIGNATPGNKLSINSPTSPDGLAQTVIATGALANKGLVVQGVIFQSGSLLELQEHTGSSVFSVGATGNTSIRTATNSVTAFQVQNSAGSGVLNVDTNTSTGLVGIGIAPAYKLDVNGDINIVGTSALRIGGTIICTASGCDATSGSGSYIQNGNGIQSNANFGIQSANATYIGAKVRGAAGQSASLLELQISNATPVFSVGSTGNVVARPSADSATAFQIQNAAGSSNLFIADTNLNYVGIGIAPAYKLDVNGDINIVGTSALRIGGTIICTASGCDATSGSGSYIQNGNGIQSNANFGIQSANATYVGGVIKGAVSQSADLFQLQNSAGTNLFNVTATGAATFQNTSDTTGAFRVLDAAGTSNVLVVDTTNKRVGINTYPTGYALDVNGDVNLTPAAASLRISGTVVCNLTGCAASSGSGNYIQNGNGVQTNGNFAIQSANIGYVGGLIRGAAGQTADLLQIQNSGAANLFSVGATGNATFQNSADNSAAFNIKQSGGTTIFWADTLQGTINATNTAGNAFIGTTNNNLSFGVVGTQSFGVGGGVKGVGGGGYGVLGQSETNASGLFQTTNTAGTNTAATLVARANTNQSANVFEVQNTAGTPVFGVSPAGIINTAVLAKNSTNSTTAFQVQSAAGTATLFNIDTTNNIISIAGNNSAELQTWATTTALGATRQGHATASDGSFIYAVGGLKAGTITDEVTYAPLNADGSVGTWSTTTALPSAVKYPSISIGNGFMYVVGGYNSANTVSSSVFYGKINSNGTISSWTESQNKIITSVGAATTVATSGYLYVMGGGTTFSTVPDTPSTSSDYARIYPDGSIGSFTAGTTLPLSRMGGAATKANGYMYFVGGANGSGAVSTIYMSSIPSDGTGALGAWSSAGTLNTARSYQGVSSSNGYLYAVGGGTPTVGNSSVEYGTLGSNGSVSGQTTATNALSSTAANYGGVAVVNGYFYVVGGVNSSGTALTTVQYSSAPRIKMAGSLDLVGISGLTSGSTLSSSGTGGSLTAGDTNIIGKIRVTGSANFLQGVAINGDFYAGGSAVFRSTTNSSTAFQIQNSSGSSVLIADTVNNIILPGIVASSTAILQKYSTLAVGSMYRTGLNAFLSYTGYPTLSFGDTLYNRIGVIQCVSYDCANPTVPSPVYIGKPNGAAISIVDTNSFDGVKLSNNNPLYVWRTSSASTQGIWYQRCGTYDCSSGNSDTKYVTAGAANTSCYGMQVTTTLLSNNFPMFLSHGSGVSTCGTKVWAMVCGDVKCDTSPTSKTQIGTQSGSDGLAVGMTYCSDALRLQTSGANMCPLVVHNTTSPSSGLEISLCNTTCSSSTSANFTVSPTVAVQNGSNARPIQVVILGNGLPVIARQNISNNIEIIHCKSLLCTTYDYNIVGTTSTSKGFSLILGSYNGQSLPQIVFNDQSTASMKFIQCKTDTCDPASNIVTVLNGAGGLVSVPTPEPVASMIGNDGLPLIFSQGSATLLQVTHCVDVYCAALSGTQSSGGVLLGSKPNAFQGLYVSSINDGSQSSGFQYTNNGLVVANYLTSDKIGNVSISSPTSTAFQVTALSSGAVVLSVDSGGTTNSVNIGTSTSVAGYGFNSATASLFRNTTNSTSQFAVQNASSSSLFNLDSTNNRINLFSAMSAISAPTSPAAAVPALNATPTVTPTGTAGATTYNYIIEAVTTIGNSAPSAAGTTATGNATLSSTNYNALSWTAFVPVSGTTTYYKIYRTVGGSTTGLVGTTTGLTFNDTGFVANGISITAGGALAASQAYFYKVTAIDSAGGESAASSEVTATTGANPPNTKTIALTWTAVTGATGYKIYRSTTTNTQVFLTATGASPFTDNGSVTIGTGSAPSIGTAYKSTNNANSALQLVIGGNGTPTGQLYVSGTVPTSSVSSLAVGTTPNAVATQGRYVYTVSSTTATLQIIDVSIPSSPVIVSTIATGTLPSSLVVQGSYVYVTNQTSNTMQIYNVSNPAGPILVSTTSTGTTPRDVKVVGRYAYIVNQISNTLQIFDVANPATPVAVSSTATGSGPIGLVVRGNYAYIGHTGSNNMTVFDISSPTTPVLTGTVAVGALTYRMSIQGKYLYVASFFSNTLIIVDISNSYNPVLVSTTPTGTGPRGAVVNGRYVYVTNATTNTLQIFDVANPAAPVSLGTVATGTTPYAPVVNGRYVYLVNSGSNNLQIFDVGGAYIQQLETGGAEIGSLMVNNAAVFAAEASFQGGINTNGSLQTTADLGVAGNSLFKTSTNSSTAFQVQNATSVALLSVDTTGNGTISINAAADTGIINIGTAYSAVVTIGKSAGTGTLIVYGNTTVNGHIISGNNSGTTTFAVGAAACTGGVATSSAGNDTAGKIVVTTGASGCAAGTIVTVTFGATYTTAPMVVLTPGDSVTSGENLRYYATPAATTFVLGTQNTTTINKTLTFYYHVIR